jgi:hypothetical protein
LDNGHVVDAILRGPGHRYSGVSSSPESGPPRHRAGGPPTGALAVPGAPSAATAAAPTTAAPADTTRRAEFQNRYQNSIATPEGKGYETSATAAFFGDSTFMRTCASPGGPVAAPFTVYFEVVQNGDLGELVFSPETDVANCIRKEVTGRRFPPPPGGYFVGRVDLKFQP